jgi:geranylgeranyl diphosphate synthase type II
MLTLDLAFLHPYKKKVDSAIKKSTLLSEPKTTLTEAIEYSLLGNAKRFRPLIVLFIAEALGSFDVMEAGLAVEYFHTASLIADDLPCMDDDDERRGKPSLHKVYGEDIALLASYTLIASGYESISLASLKHGQNGPLLCQKALEFVSKRAGILGATNGQFLDLYAKPLDRKTLDKIIYQKTVTLFEISFGLGYLFGSGKTEGLELVTKAAYHLGYAFQLADDLQDYDQDEMNMAKLLGKKEAYKMYLEHREEYSRLLEQANISHKGLNKLVSLLDTLADA